MDDTIKFRLLELAIGSETSPYALEYIQKRYIFFVNLLNLDTVLTKNGNLMDVLDLSVRTSNALVRTGIITFDDLSKMKWMDLLRTKNFGLKCFNELMTALEEAGFYAVFERKKVCRNFPS